MKFFIIFVKSFQSIYDLAMQQYGSIDHIDILLQDNPTLNLSDDLAVGTQIKIREEISVLDEAAKKYFTDSNTKVATWTNDGVSPGYNPGFGSCPVANVDAKNTDDEILAAGTAPSGGSASLIIPDIEVIVNGASQGNKVVKSPIIITPTTIGYLRPNPSGSAIAYLTGDDGWKLANNPDPYIFPSLCIPALLSASDAKMLLFDNVFGHKNRFTGINGGYWDYATSEFKLADGTVSDQATTFGTVASNTSYLIDHHTGLGWKWNIEGGALWSTHITNAHTLTHAGYSDWELPSRKELESLMDLSFSGLIQLIPFNSNNQVKSSTPPITNPSLSHNSVVSMSWTASRADTSADAAYFVRRHFI